MSTKEPTPSDQPADVFKPAVDPTELVAKEWVLPYKNTGPHESSREHRAEAGNSSILWEYLNNGGESDPVIDYGDDEKNVLQCT